jgi:hypothetical protein
MLRCSRSSRTRAVLRGPCALASNRLPRRRGSGDTSRWTRIEPCTKTVAVPRLGTSWYKQLAPRDLLGPLGTSTLSPPQAGPRVLEIWDNNGCRHNRHAEASAQRNLEMQSRHRAWCVLVGPTRADAEASVQRTGWRSVQAVQGVPPQRESARQTRLRARSLAAPSQTYLATSSSGPFGFAEARSSRFRRSRGALNGPLPSRSWSYPSASRAATGPSGCVPLRERVGRVHREFVRVAKRKKN